MDRTKIYNLALSAIGTRANVTSPDENTKESRTCNLWYETVRDQVLRAAPWPSAYAAQRLALEVERGSDDWVGTDPAPGWQYAYSPPDDMIYPRYINGYQSFVLVDGRIATNVEDAILVYTKREEDPNRWDVQLQMAIAYALGAHICLALEGKQQLAQLIAQRANDLILQARQSAANTDEFQLETVAPWHAARGVHAANLTRYIYPYGPVVSVANVN